MHDGELIHIDGGPTGLLLATDGEGRLRQLALGGPEACATEPAFPTWLYPLAYPTHGEEALREPALEVVHADGSPSTRLVVRSVEEPGAHPHGRLHRIELVDRVAPLVVTLHVRTWPEHGLVEQWVEVANEADAPVRLVRAASAAPARAAADAWLTHWGGGWAHEWTEVAEPLAPGVKTVAGHGGVRSSLYLPPVACGRPAAALPRRREVLLATVRWGGDVRFDAEVAMHGQARLLAGHQHRGAARVLAPGGSFTTPATVLAWSDAGVGPITRRLHRWVREHVVRDGDRPRAIAFNNWEAMGFSMGTASVCEVIDGAAEVGAELFLLDDGWFGVEHPRDDDTQGLGDWDVDPAKFPDGLGPVVDHALGAGLRFGLWVEPEMVNPRSALYEQHPDWVVAEPGRERREERHQLVLDLCQPEVAAFVVDVVDRALALHPGISYLKWDANRDLFEQASPALPADRQSHLPIDRVRATEAVMAEVARRHPDVELMLCASGGGRSNLSDLRWFHELWTSDDTDPVDRARIQWGASHLLPASVLGAHVTRWGQKPVPFSCAVAMSGRFGFDIDPRTMTDEERAVAAQAAADYRRIRGLVQQGDLHRLVSPVGSDRGALAFLAPDAPEASDPGAPCAVVYAFLLEGGDGGLDASKAAAPVVLAGLDPDRRYQVEDVTPGAPTRGEVWQRLGRELGSADAQEPVVAWPAGPAPAARVVVVSPEG
ncbi:MAG: alpha-galactosidase [Acidimicrobiales bacterium]